MASGGTDADYRILLVGRTGHGKSSTANTIVGKYVFEVSDESFSKTKTCQWSQKCSKFGKIVEVVDTPGFFDTDLTEKDIHKELIKSILLSKPGFHAIAFVLMKGRFTEEIQKTQDLFFKVFGKGVENFACIILTDTDNDESMNKYIKDKPHPKLAELVQTCGNRVVAVNNKAGDDTKCSQVRRLFEVVDGMKRGNSTEYFTNIAFELVQSYLKERCPQEVTTDSIRLLQRFSNEMELSDYQIKFINRTINLFSQDEDETNDEDRTLDASETSQKCSDEELSSKMQYGNLPIFDATTNERIPNSKRKVRLGSFTESTGSTKQLEATDTETLSDTVRSDTDRVSGRMRSLGVDGNTTSAIDPGSVEIQSKNSDICEGMGTESRSPTHEVDISSEAISSQHRVKRKPRSRKYRQIDINSVISVQNTSHSGETDSLGDNYATRNQDQKYPTTSAPNIQDTRSKSKRNRRNDSVSYEIPDTPDDEFKNNVNNDKESKWITKFVRFWVNVGSKLKQKSKACNIL